MLRLRKALLAPSLAILVVAGVSGAASAESAVEPVRLSVDAFGTVAEVEVRDLPRAAALDAAREAVSEIYTVAQLVDAGGTLPGGVRALNEAAGAGDRTIDPRLARLLVHGLQLCLWSEGAHGPVGGALYRLWLDAAPGLPGPAALRSAVATAGCGGLSVSRAAAAEGDAGWVFALAAETVVEPIGMARGFAVDHGFTVLERHGAANALIEIGPLRRASGGGPDGKGWLTVVPRPGADDRPLDRIWLRDQSLAVVAKTPFAGSPPRPLLDQRTGVPARGVVQVVTVTELAIDAEALASTLFISGLREGQMRLGRLSPRPSVYWLLGEGQDSALESTYRWTELARVDAD